MLKRSKYTLTLEGLILVFLLGLGACSKTSQQAELADQFKSPSDKTRLHTWWHWMQGNITREGITKDLETMKANGVVQATILNIGLLDQKEYGIPRVLFNTPEWYELFAFALSEAKRLGMTIGIHNSDGWSSSGGPWITPEQSMKALTWNKTVVSKGASKIHLDKPFNRMDFYQDIAVLAIPSRNKRSVFQQQNPVFQINNTIVDNSICDGSMTGGPIMKFKDKLTVSVSSPISVSKVALMPLKPFTWMNPSDARIVFEVYSSNNGTNYTSLGQITCAGYNQLSICNISKTKARYFKLELRNWSWGDAFIEMGIAELELLAENETPLFKTDIEEIGAKTAYTMGAYHASYLPTTNNKGIASSDIISLTDKLKKGDTLDWLVPEGDWEIYRLGYTTTKAVNAPATSEGEGLECDKLDTNALNFHFSQFPQKLIDKAGPLTGNTFKFFLIDSWECGFQNWTPALATAFKKRRGYALEPYLPILMGVQINDAATSEAFLYDYRKTLSELLEENYYGHFSKLCHKNKLEMHAELIYGNGNYPPLDILKASQLADMPMFEFWAGHNGKTTITEYTAVKNPNLDFPMSAAFFYDKPLVGAEAYTAMAHYSETPLDLKPFGDRAFASGINQFILHSYVHQPFDSTPGFTLGPFGSHFNRNNPWYTISKGWMDYHARTQLLLQQGTMQADVLYYVGDQLPQLAETWNNPAPSGYQSLLCNTDALLNKLTYKDGKLWYRNVGFSLIYLPQNIRLELRSLQKIAYFVNQGMQVCGYKPGYLEGVSNLAANKEAFETILALLWTGNEKTSLGKGAVWKTTSVAEALKKIQLVPDISFSIADSTTFLFHHRVTQTDDIYFVCNQTANNQEVPVRFRTTKPNASIWNPASGVQNSIKTAGKEDNTGYTLKLGPYQSTFFVFSNAGGSGFAPYPETLQELPVTVQKVQTSFQGKSAPAMCTDTTITDLTLSSNPSERYFSGFINYEISFSVPKSALSSKQKKVINLGFFSAACALTLNGVDLGTSWQPSENIDCKASLKESNTLLIKVATTYRNRIIGDYATYGILRNIWSTNNGGMKNYLSSTHPLRTSGIVGPLKVFSE